MSDHDLKCETCGDGRWWHPENPCPDCGTEANLGDPFAPARHSWMPPPRLSEYHDTGGMWWRVPVGLAVMVGLPFGAAAIINRIPLAPSDDTLITECVQAGGHAIYTSNDDGDPHFITCDPD